MTESLTDEEVKKAKMGVSRKHKVKVEKRLMLIGSLQRGRDRTE